MNKGVRYRGEEKKGVEEVGTKKQEDLSTAELARDEIVEDWSTGRSVRRVQVCLTRA